MIKVYRKTATIKAEQFDGSQKKMFGYRIIPSSIMDVDKRAPVYYSIFINDDEPEPDDDLPVDDIEIVFEIGYWVVKESDEIKVLADKDFKQQYIEYPTIPQIVIDVIRYANIHKHGIYWVLNTTPKQLVKNNIISQSKIREYSNFFRQHDSQDMFARAWLDGYQVEEDK